MMDLESECLVHEALGDNEDIKNSDSILESSGNLDESRVHNNGSYVVGNSEEKEQGAEALGSVNSPPVGLKPGGTPTSTGKGKGLRRWRRIKRDPDVVGTRSNDTGKMMIQESSNTGVDRSKRMLLNAERQQKSEGSVSSTNAVFRSLDGFSLPDDLGLGMNPSFPVGTDSENSEDRSSRSSTAASAPKIKYDPRDNIRMRSLSGKNSMHSMQRVQHGKGHMEATKKARGERAKIEKENSHSSVESDLRSNFLFMQGTNSTNIGVRNGRPKYYVGENVDEVQGSERHVNDGHHGGYGRDAEEGYEEISPEDVVADSSWEGKEERSGNRGSSIDQDPLVESIFALQAAQEALGKEVLKFKEISEDASVADSYTDLQSELIETERSPYGAGVQSVPRAVQSEEVETSKRDMEADIEDLFKRKIEAEVEYLAISQTIQNLRHTVADPITVLEEQKALASEQTKILDKLDDPGKRAAMLKHEAEKLETLCEEIASADETLKLQKNVCKYSSCFLIQLVLLLVILGVFMFQSSLDHVEVVPT